MRDLGVRLIFADSPEARGRAERINETFQDRLVAEFALRRVTTSAAATEYLNRHFIPRYAKRFGVEPEEGAHAEAKVPGVSPAAASREGDPWKRRFTLCELYA